MWHYEPGQVHKKKYPGHGTALLPQEDLVKTVKLVVMMSSTHFEFEF